jgi:serine/threonine-protein kinase RsbW
VLISGATFQGRASQSLTTTGANVGTSSAFKREIEALSKVFEFTGDFARRNGLGQSIVFAMNLAVEELFTNIVKYGKKDGEDVTVDLGVEGSYLVIEITESDAEPFDITNTEEVDVSGGVDQREEGGLGIHLIRRIMDYVKYEYEDGKARITLKKRLEGANV